MMVTGDYHHTAIAVARDVGMLQPDSPIIVIDAVRETHNRTQARHSIASAAQSDLPPQPSLQLLQQPSADVASPGMKWQASDNQGTAVGCKHPQHQDAGHRQSPGQSQDTAPSHGQGQSALHTVNHCSAQLQNFGFKLNSPASQRQVPCQSQLLGQSRVQSAAQSQTPGRTQGLTASHDSEMSLLQPFSNVKTQLMPVTQPVQMSGAFKLESALPLLPVRRTSSIAAHPRRQQSIPRHVHYAAFDTASDDPSRTM